MSQAQVKEGMEQSGRPDSPAWVQGGRGVPTCGACTMAMCIHVMSAKPHARNPSCRKKRHALHMRCHIFVRVPFPAS